MKDFPHASFAPDTIALMTTAMDSALARLPHPVASAHVKSIAETILRSAQEGERDPMALERMAFLELMISSRDESFTRFSVFSSLFARNERSKVCKARPRVGCTTRPR